MNRRKSVIHIPHAGEIIPDDINFCADRAELMRQHNALRDDYVLSLIPDSYDYLVSFDYSRIVCDVERFLENESMEKYGMGFCYVRGFNGKKIRESGYNPERELKLYTAHHQRLNEICRENNSVFIIDLHSYSKKIIPDDMTEKGKSSPDICIGFDDEYITDEIVDYVSGKNENRIREIIGRIISFAVSEHKS